MSLILLRLILPLRSFHHHNQIQVLDLGSSSLVCTLRDRVPRVGIVFHTNFAIKNSGLAQQTHKLLLNAQLAFIVGAKERSVLCGPEFVVNEQTGKSPDGVPAGRTRPVVKTMMTLWPFAWPLHMVVLFPRLHGASLRPGRQMLFKPLQHCCSSNALRHRPIFWIALSEYPANESAFAPPPRNE